MSTERTLVVGRGDRVDVRLALQDVADVGLRGRTVARSSSSARSWRSGAVFFERRDEGVVGLLLARGTCGRLAVDDLRVAVHLLVDALAELLAERGAAGGVVDGVERDARLRAVEAVVGRGRR